MKRYLLSLFAVLVFAISYGQVLRFSDTSNKWFERGEEDAAMNFYYTGDTTIGGLTYLKTNWIYGIREDIVAKKVYARLIMPIAPVVDTIEHVLYDYNLQIGDTLKNTVNGFLYNGYVTGMDSFSYNGQWYKIWIFSMNGYANLKVVEGLGCINQLFTPIYPNAWFGGLPYLSCFMTGGFNPTINIAPHFTNPSTCALSVTNLSAEKPKISVPNPANTNSQISIPQDYHNGSMLIYDAMGRQCTNIRLLVGTDVPFTNRLSASGMYYFVITSADNKNSQKGAFIFVP